MLGLLFPAIVVLLIVVALLYLETHNDHMNLDED